MDTKRLQIAKIFQETPSEIEFCTFWWYSLKPEVKFRKRSPSEVETGNAIWIHLPRIFDMYHHPVLRNYPMTSNFRKINTLGSTEPARIVGVKIFKVWLLSLDIPGFPYQFRIYEAVQFLLTDKTDNTRIILRAKGRVNASWC